MRTTPILAMTFASLLGAATVAQANDDNIRDSDNITQPSPDMKTSGGTANGGAAGTVIGPRAGETDDAPGGSALGTQPGTGGSSAGAGSSGGSGSGGGSN